MSQDIPRGPTRRQFIALGAGAFVVAALPIAAQRRGRLVRRTLPAMGTLAEVAVVSRDADQANRAIDAAMAELRRVERMLTRFSTTSELSRVNQVAARRAMPVAAEAALVIAAALRWADDSGGAFDPAIGGAVALWDVTHRTAPPAAGDVRRLAGRHLHRAVELGTLAGEQVVLFHDSDVQLDLGGIAKGYAVDRAVTVLREWGVAHALVNAGGDLYALGGAPDGDDWRIGIQDPADDRRIIETIPVRDAAVATSGSYQQFFRWRGQRFHHLLDPETGAPRVARMESVTTHAESCMDADAAATAVFGAAADDRVRMLARCPGSVRVVHTI